MKKIILAAALTIFALPAVAQQSGDAGSGLAIDNGMALSLAEKLPAMSENEVSDCAMSMALLSNQLPEGDAKFGAQAAQQIYIVKMGLMTGFDQAKSDAFLMKGTIFSHLKSGGQVSSISSIVEEKQLSCIQKIDTLVNSQ